VLSNITILVLAIFCPIWGGFCFIKGYNLGAKETKKPEIKVESPKKKIEKAKTDKKMAEKQKKLNTLFENIDAYDGSSIGQKEI
jgi:hypothetical protein